MGIEYAALDLINLASMVELTSTVAAGHGSSKRSVCQLMMRIDLWLAFVLGKGKCLHFYNLILH
jgi:hypothetical protein